MTSTTLGCVWRAGCARPTADQAQPMASATKSRRRIQPPTTTRAASVAQAPALFRRPRALSVFFGNFRAPRETAVQPRCYDEQAPTPGGESHVYRWFSGRIERRADN